MSSDVDWDTAASSLLSRSAVPAALATGALLAEAKSRWEGRVVPRTSMHDLLFTVPGHPHPFEESVSVAWADDGFTFTLSEGGIVRSGDRCRPGNAAEVLDSFLVQLVGGEPATTSSVANDRERVVRAVNAAWEEGCPVASDPDATAPAALRRVGSDTSPHERSG